MPLPDSAVGIVALYPSLLGTYADGGNVAVLERRLAWRGIASDVVTVEVGEAVPEDADLYVLGGAEDGPQSLATDVLAESGVLHRAADRGAVVFAVCAGLQILGTSFAISGGRDREGLGLVDIMTKRGERRAVGEVLVEPADGLGLPVLSGYENHGGMTIRGSEVAPLGRVLHGVGNGDGTEGFISGRILGTYLHGPGLPRNPALADLVLSWVVGDLEPLDDHDATDLRAERVEAIGRGASSRLKGWLDRRSRVSRAV
jgi:CobQ-like glutamine amidotransferase family enzyme